MLVVGLGTRVDDPAAASTRMVSAGEATDAMLRDMESRLVRTWQQLRTRTQRCQIAVENLDSSHEELRTIIAQLRSTTAASHEVLRSAAMANHRVELGRGDARAVVAIDPPLERALRLAPIIAFAFYGDGAIAWGHARGRRLDAEHAVALFAPGEADRLVEVARIVSSTRVGQRIELVLTTDEAACTYDLRVEPDGDTACACGFDITPSKQVEAALREADQRKDDFLATLSHELRNPLTPLRVALDVVRLADGDGARIDHSLAIMERQVDHLTHLVDELLDLSRIARGKIEIDHATIDPASIVDAALDTARPLIDRRHHQLRVHLPEVACRVVGDFGRLTQALTNLLSNAAKYTPEGGHIDLDLVVDATRDLLFVRVRDDGVGISPDMIPHIFDIFVQCRDTRGESQGGLGIGLNLVRRLVELHGGLVTETSAGAGLGSEFTIELPIAHTAAGRDVDADRVW